MFDNGVVATTGRELLRRYYSLSSYYLCAAFSPLLLNEETRGAFLSLRRHQLAHVTDVMGST